LPPIKVPKMKNREKELKAFERLLDVMDELREKCAWDRKQTMESLRPQTIEETYELCDAILKNDQPNVAKELGDLLLHVVFYAKIGSENGTFDITQVINLLRDKLIFRHPHVFGETQVSGAEQVVQNWEQLKMKEKDGNKRILSGVPDALPALLKAYRMQDKARAVGFDWEQRDQVWDKVREELSEFEAELDKLQANPKDPQARKKAEGEFGDFLFSVINAGRLYDINPDTALDMTCTKFRRRFTYLEEHTIRQGRDLKDMTLAQMDEIWDEAKRLEREGKL
jgi:XTP/dITP diphosphohydrolase